MENLADSDDVIGHSYKVNYLDVYCCDLTEL